MVTKKGNPAESNFEDLEMQKWNISADRTQRVDKETWVIWLVIMFTPRVNC